jgi:hypothetical protein
MINLNKENKVNNIINCKNTYSWENTENDKKWTIKIIDGLELLTDAVIKALKDFKEDIFFNNNMCDYHFMMYKINNVWVEGFYINPCTMEMEIGLY